MTYRHSFRTLAAPEAVLAFHRRPASLAAITPPPLAVRLGATPEWLGDGDVLDFRLGLGPLGLRWVSRIEDLRPDGFTDRQIHGPFRRWVHVHRFIPRADGTVEVRDEVDAALAPHPLWAAVGLLMKLSLPALFAYRAWRTRRLLEQGR